MYEYAIQPRRRSRKPAAQRGRRQPLKRRRLEKATVVTLLEARMRASVDGATESTFLNVHVGTVQEVIMAVRERAPRALLLSTALVDTQTLPAIARLVTKNPGVLPVAVSHNDGPVPGDLLLGLGACGIRRFLDLNGRDGWDKLRGLLDDGGGETEAAILGALLPEMEAASDEWRHFFTALVRLAPRTTTVRALSRELGIKASSLMSRFFRAALPAPKKYLAMTRLLYAASFLSAREVSLADMSNALNYSSPQSFGRHVRMMLGLTAGEFRREIGLQAGIAHFIDRLIRPYLGTLATFRPINTACQNAAFEANARSAAA